MDKQLIAQLKTLKALAETLYWPILLGIIHHHVIIYCEEDANQCIELVHSCGLVQYTKKLQLTETTYSAILCVEILYLIPFYIYLVAK